MIVTGLVCYFCWLILSKVICFQEGLDRRDLNNQNLTLEKVAGILFTNNTKIFLEVITMIYAYGTCLGYCIFIRDSTKDLISDPFYVSNITFFLLHSFINSFINFCSSTLELSANQLSYEFIRIKKLMIPNIFIYFKVLLGTMTNY